MLAIILGSGSILLLGAAMGSWLATVDQIRRPGSGKLWLRSRCAVGGEQLSMRDLIPVIGWLRVRGRCRRCLTPISGHYPVLEMAAAGLFWYTWYRLGAPFAFDGTDGVSSSQVFLLLVEWLLVAVALRVVAKDLVTGEIPLGLVGAASALWLVSVLVQNGAWSNHLAGALVGAGFFLWQYVLSRGRWIGGGDIWLGWLMGMVLGWPGVLVALGLGYVFGAVFSLVLVAAKKWRAHQTVPLAPFLMLALFVTHWWGTAIVVFLQAPR